MEQQHSNGDAATTFLEDNLSTPLQPVSLSEVGNILQTGLENDFSKIKIDVVTCPALTREPFNLAGVGLCGNPTLLVTGGYATFMPSPIRWRNSETWNLQTYLSYFCYDSFIIGAGYAARPYMPFNGHLIMNATYRAHTSINNASRIVFADTSNGQRRIETLNNPNQMICSFMGNFFISEGRPGMVLRLRAKGRKSNLDIITLMQRILYKEFYMKRRCIVGLGGVLRMRNGRVALNVMREEYPEVVLSVRDFARWYQCHDINLESDLIAVGALVNSKPQFLSTELRYGVPLSAGRYQFHSFSNYGGGGQFINNITKKRTEYIGYFNLARQIYYVDYCT